MSRLKISIGQFSHITNLSKRALRYYDEKKLLVPEKNVITNYRYYKVSDIEKGIKISNLTRLSFGIDEIKEILEAELTGDINFVKMKLQKRDIELRKEIKLLSEFEKKLIIPKKEVSEMNMSKSINGSISNTIPLIKEIPEILVVSKSKMGSYCQTTPELVGELIQIIITKENLEKCVQMTGSPMLICRDDIEHKESENVLVEVSIPISKSIEIPESSEDIVLKNLPKTTVLSMIHTGSYEKLGESSLKVFEYAENHNYEVAGNMREIFHNGLLYTPEEELKTEIQLPIK
ncbi:MerR family transcriptional regulator [Methanococcus voltae]|uniref:Effector-binding domain-containing protein n=1 Tax=Methanococcus voltae TaxID=2188 RepID=A0A8J7UTP1_METVO|nr:MerR family transcriptional regulator [Methanococcus voltae]MBP2173050.1 effector-binding domain-containing protein [Methanococcus voltae]MBP2201894.1 effector-binding domain-containing protein [Methanococcus voltae]